MELVHNPHDKMFKKVFKIRENAASLLRNILPPEIQKDLNLEALYFENDSYVSQDFADYYSDLLTSVPVAGSEQEAKIYFLFEHKSTNYPDTPLQLLRYMLEIWDQHGKITRNPDGKLPIVIPVVVTHPRSLWKDKRIADFVNSPSEAFRAYIPDFDYLLYDSTRNSGDIIYNSYNPIFCSPELPNSGELRHRIAILPEGHRSGSLTVLFARRMKRI